MCNTCDNCRFISSPMYIYPCKMCIGYNLWKEKIPNNKNGMKRDRDYWKEKYEKIEKLLKIQEGCKYCIDVGSKEYSRCSRCENKEQWFFDINLLKEL